MGIAEKIYEVVKDLPEPLAAEVLNFAENKRATTSENAVREAKRAAALAALAKHAGKFKVVKFHRADLHDRAGLR